MASASRVQGWWILLSTLLLLSLGACGGGAGVSGPPPPAILAFTATPSVVTVGQASQLAWTVTGATSLSVDGGVGTVSGSGVSVSPTVTTPYTLTATGPGGTAQARVTVTVVPAPLIERFTATPAGVEPGGTCSLQAVFSGGTGRLEPDLGPVTSGVPLSSGPLNGTTTFTLTVTNAAGDRVQATTTVTVAPPVAIGSFSAARNPITAGTSTTLTAVFSDATVAVIDRGVGLVRSGVPIGVSPTVSTTYTLTVQGVGGPLSRSLSLGVVPAASIQSFTAAPSVILPGTSTQLTASFQGGTGVIDGLGPVASGVPIATGPLSATTVFTLGVTNAAGDRVQAQVTVVVGSAVAITGFSAGRSVLTAGSGTTLTPAFVNATSATLSPGIGPVASGVAVAVHPAATTTYTLTVDGPGGPLSRSVTVTMVPAPTLTSFTANPTQVAASGTSLLTAVFSQGVGVVDHGLGQVTSGVPLSTGALAATTTFTLTVTNAAGDSLQRSTTVQVGNPPTTALTYDTSTAVYTVGTDIGINWPHLTGGTPDWYDISPALPDGLWLDPDFGEIVGVPSLASPRTVYTVTAFNPAGSATCQLTFTVKDIPPVIAYGASFRYTSGSAVSKVTPTSTGGVVVTWAISPALPAGLTFNTGDGSWTGTPTALSASQTYTVTATNSGGTAQTTFTMTVDPPPPTITAQPADLVVDIGDTATFTVTATGTGTLSYQWYRSSTLLAGATGTSYTTGALTSSDGGGTYKVTVSDTYGHSVTSSSASLAVRPFLTTWLRAHPTIANAIRWQWTWANVSNFYTPPGDAQKIAWASWNAGQQADLAQAYDDLVAWAAAGASQVTMGAGSASPTDQPANTHFNVNDDLVTSSVHVTQAYFWRLYTAQVAFSLWVEITGQVPWSIQTYDATSLRYLFDSTTMGWYLPTGEVTFGTYGGAPGSGSIPDLRADNLPHTTFADPRWTYPFLRDGGMIQGSRLASIGKVLDWMRGNMAHFFGADTFGTCWAVWQYRGYSPISKIVAGTVDANNPGLGVMHWTEGCHGSIGFLHVTLRSLNIPVQPVWVDGHELACFLTERLYLDHGDDPYNQLVKAAAAPSLDLLISEATYQSWFTADLTRNIKDGSGLANVGRMTTVVH